ncbi:MAG: hypothetical protein H7Z42_10775 [Roseiflexaceae bacterium]|nr:hypothetical protein [Roseiflexaceae bacterium]
MNLTDYLEIFRRRWPLLLALPLLAGMISLAAGLAQPKRYAVTGSTIVSRGVTDQASTAGVTWAREDTVAQDLPTIISSAIFARDVADELAAQGRSADQATVQRALHAVSDGKIVRITATADNPELAAAIVQSAIQLLQRNGLRYWGDPTWTPTQPGVNIRPLDPPGTPVPVPTTREIALDAALRAAVGLIVALGLVAGLEARGRG